MIGYQVTDMSLRIVDQRLKAAALSVKFRMMAAALQMIGATG